MFNNNYLVYDVTYLRIRFKNSGKVDALSENAVHLYGIFPSGKAYFFFVL